MIFLTFHKDFLGNRERETGFEPATPTLARSCSTTELLSHCYFKELPFLIGRQKYCFSIQLQPKT